MIQNLSSTAPIMKEISTLMLAENRIKTVSIPSFVPNIKHLDVSKNLISDPFSEF
jgi:hypothetical protein